MKCSSSRIASLSRQEGKAAKDLFVLQLGEPLQCVQVELVTKHSGSSPHLDQTQLPYSFKKCDCIREGCETKKEGLRK